MDRRKALIFTFLLALCVGCDHAAKRLAEGALASGARVSLAADVVRLELTANRGAFLSLGARLPRAWRDPLLLGAVPLLLVGVCALAIRAGLHSRAAVAGLGLVAGGGSANWLDRLLHDGAVTDFVSLGIGPLRTGIFNLADVSIFAGVGLLLLTHRSAPERPPAKAMPGAD